MIRQQPTTTTTERRAMFLVYALLITACTLTVIGEVMLKLGISSVTERVGAFSLSLDVLLATFTNWQVILGFALVFGGSLFWLGVISRVELSFAYPLLAMNYVILLIPARFLLNEMLSPARIAGAFIIVAGVIVITWGQK
jgi:drug/metabolite transporter (DMT)-like permease